MGEDREQYVEARALAPVAQPNYALQMPGQQLGSHSLLNIAALMTVARQDGFRRDIQRAIREAEALVTIDKQTAESCFYALPRGDTKICGPSIGLAETLAACYGNIVVSADDVEIGEKEITVRGWAIDTQSGAGTQDFTRRRIMKNVYEQDDRGRDKFDPKTKKKIKAGEVRYDDDMIGVTIAAARSILYRNLVLRLVPRPMVRKLFEAARNVAIGDAVTFEDRQKKCVGHWMQLGVEKDRLLQHLSHTAMNQITTDDMDYLLGLEQAIKLGDTTIEIAFAPPERDEQPEQKPEPGKRRGRPPKPEAPEPDAKQDRKALTAEILKIQAAMDREEFAAIKDAACPAPINDASDSELAGLLAALKNAGGMLV